MWHEARKQEKLIRSQMIDSVKRNERRKLFYENVRKDPEQFMQIHGRKCQIHMDPSVARAAEASTILRRWQGDPNIMIDRFDVRSHLDFIADLSKSDDKQRGSVDVEELQCEYERYRILILNEFDRVSESSFLEEINAKEFWPSETNSASSLMNRAEMEKKKQSREKKAAVGFSYDDTPTVKGRDEESEESDDDDELIEPDEFDLKVDVDSLDAERKRNLNKLGMRYGINSGAFSSLLKMDRREQDETHQLKQIEKAKLALAGRQAKAERALLKKKRALIVGKGCLNEEATTTLLSFVTQNKSEYVESSSSSSESEREEKTEFITSFGGDEPGERRDEEEEEGAAVQGPTLPSAEFRRIFELKTRRSSSPEDFGSVSQPQGGWSSSKFRSAGSPSWRRRSRSAERSSRRAWSRSRSRDRERSDGGERRRSRERDRERERSKGTSSNSRKNDERRRSREESGSREHSRRSRSRSRSRSRDERKRKRSRSPSNQRHRHRSRDKKEARRARSSSRSSAGRNATPSPHKGTGSVLSPSRNSDTSPLAIRSSMSESEKERIEVENRRRRIRRTSKMHRQQMASNHGEKSEDESEKKAMLAHRLRTQMQRALRKTAEELKEEERQKLATQMRERRKREERLYEESLEIRRREREKRHRERRRRYSSSSSG